MNKSVLPIVVFFASVITSAASAATTPFTVRITGAQVQVEKSLELSDVGQGKTAVNFDFSADSGETYNFDLKYVKLPKNRSYPTNLDITIKDSKGDKLGYLFWANNGVEALRRIGVFGLIIDVNGKPMNVQLTFPKTDSGANRLRVAQLADERLIQDTLVSKFGFQMIRPVLLPAVSSGVRSQTYSLDAHPYAVNYTLKDHEEGNVQFQFNLYQTDSGNNHLLQRIYYHADTLAALREGMFAGKYFDKRAGTIKLVYYPALGQTHPQAPVK